MIKVSIMRFAIRVMARLFWRGRAARNLKVTNRKVPVRDGQVSVRIYSPLSAGPHPALLYFHGGGFVVGNLDTVDGPCRDIAARSSHVVVSVDYRLAPESRFPAAAHDCIDALVWLYEHAGELAVQKDRIRVAGDSAGGNLAAVAALHDTREQHNRISGQVLIYPVTHHYRYGTDSYVEKAKGYGLTRDMMVWFWDLYYGGDCLPDGDGTAHPLSTPLAVDDLSGLAPALVMTAEHDPLRDEGVQYARKMQDAAVSVQHTLYADAQHGFLGSMGPTPLYERGLVEITDWLAALD